MKASATLVFLCASVFLVQASDRPNFILCMTDDQGWGDVGYNGHPHLKTPHLDRMSAEGVTFTRFYSAAAMCSPTRGSCYTGRNPYRFGITFAMKGRLEASEIPITTVLKKKVTRSAGDPSPRIPCATTARHGSETSTYVS